MALLRVLAFDHEGRPVQLDTWLDDLQLYLLSDSKDSVSLFDLASGAATAPPATADSSTCSEWLTRDAAARLAIRNHLPLAECAHFGQHRTAQALYNGLVARYSSPATAALGRLLLPYLFPSCPPLPQSRTSFPTFALVTLATALLDHFLSLDPTSLTIDLLEQHLLDAETSAVAVGAARGTPRPPFFEGCSPSPLAPSYASAAAADVSVHEDVGAGSASAKRRSSKGKDGRGGGGGSSGGGGGSGSGGGSSSGGGGGGGTVGGALVAVVEAVVGVAAVEAVGLVVVGLALGVSVLGVASVSSSSVGTCGRLHTPHRCFSRLDDDWRAEFGDDVVLSRWADLLKSRITIFDLDFDAILSAMYALSVSAEGDCYRCVPPDPGIAAAVLGASESGTLPGTAPAAALHTFTLVSGSSLYTLTTKPSEVAASAQVSASGQVAASCSCRLLSHQTLPWQHHQGHPSLPRLCGMHSPLLVSCLPRSLPPLPPLPAPPCLPCVEGRQRAPAHSSSFPPTTAPLQTLHMDMWGPARVSGQRHERYFLLVVDDYTRYTTVFPLRSKGQVVDVLIPWIRTVRLQLHERFGQDLPVLRLHSDRSGEFSSNILRDFCRGEGTLQSFTLPDSPQQNGIAKRRIGLVMEVARTSMIHAAAPHFLWPFAIPYAAHQLNLWPHVSLPETSPTLRWTGEVVDKLSPHAIPCVFLGIVPDAPVSQFYHPTSRRVFPSQDVTFDELVPFYRLFPYRSAPPPPPPLFLAPDPPLVDPLPPQGPAPSGTGGAEPGGVATGGVEPRGAEPEGVEPGGAALKGAESGGAEPQGAASSRGFAGASPRLSPKQLREWFVWHPRLWSGASGAGGAGATGAGGTGAAGASVTGGTAATGLGGARTRGTGAAGIGGVGGAGARVLTESGSTGASGAGAGGASVGGTGAGGAGAVDPGGTVRPRPYFVPLLQQVLGTPPSAALTPPLLCPPSDQLRPPLQQASPLPAPLPYTEQSRGLTESREPASRPVFPVRTARRVPWSRPPPVPNTHAMTLRPSSVPLRVPLPAPPEASLPEVLDPESDRSRIASPTVSRLLATAVTYPSFEFAAASALVAELLDFAAACRLDYATTLIAESVFASPPSVGGRPECTRHPDPRSYAEAITGPYSSQWQAAMDAEIESWKSTGTYVDEVPPPGANIVDGMWIFRVKRPPGSLPAFKARYIARGFSQRQRVDYFQTFSPTSKMTTLRVLLHVVAQRDYELHSLDFSTAFLQGSPHEEILLRRQTGFTESFPAGTQWSLRQPVYDLRQAPRKWHDTLRTTLAALGFAPATADRSLFLRTDTSLPPFYVLVYVLLRFGFQFSSPQPCPLSTSHSLSAPPSEESVEPSGSYPELVGCLIKSGMGLLLGGRGPVLLTSHADASCVDDSATQRSSQGYTFSLGSGSVSWRYTRSSSVLSSSCEAEIYAGAMPAQELRWLTYLLTDLGEQPCSPPILYQPGKLRLAYVATRANTADVFTKALPPGDHQRFVTVLGLLPLLFLTGLVTTYESVEPSGPYPELVGCLMYLMMCTRPDLAYPLSLLAPYVAPVRRAWGLCLEDGVKLSSLVMRTPWVDDSATQRSSKCEAEIYAGAMAAQELRWLTYLLTDLGEQPRSPLVLYVDNKAMIALCQEHRLEHRTKHIALRYFLARELQ
ncbi:unnamed protein product [Closterium sp. NIES-53]